MKKLWIMIVVALAGYLYLNSHKSPSVSTSASQTVIVETRQASTDAVLAQAFANRRSNVQVTGEGAVTRLLPDDNQGSRHQKFIIRLASGQTLLVAHNIDVAPRVAALKSGDRVSFCGEYAWNEKGGVIHWTHHAPSGNHPAGWIKHNGRSYQ